MVSPGDFLCLMKVSKYRMFMDHPNSHMVHPKVVKCRGVKAEKLLFFSPSESTVYKSSEQCNAYARRANCTTKPVFADFVIISNLPFLWLGKLKVELKPDVDKLTIRKTESRSETNCVYVARTVGSVCAMFVALTVPSLVDSTSDPCQ